MATTAPAVTPPGLNGSGSPPTDAEGQEAGATLAEPLVEEVAPASEGWAGPVPATPPTDPIMMFIMQMQLQQQQQSSAAAQMKLQQQQAAAAAAQQQLQMMEMMKLLANNGKSHLANTRLDVKNFARIEQFMNKREDWRGWKKHFTCSVRDCDADFAELLEKLVRRQDTEDDVEVTKESLTPTEQQLSAALHTRLTAVTIGEAGGIVRRADEQQRVRGVASAEQAIRPAHRRPYGRPLHVHLHLQGRGQEQGDPERHRAMGTDDRRARPGS